MDRLQLIDLESYLVMIERMQTSVYIDVGSTSESLFLSDQRGFHMDI